MAGGRNTHGHLSTRLLVPLGTWPSHVVLLRPVWVAEHLAPSSREPRRALRQRVDDLRARASLASHLFVSLPQSVRPHPATHTARRWIEPSRQLHNEFTVQIPFVSLSFPSSGSEQPDHCGQTMQCVRN